ncbi:Pimeloyl-ACP methyl ester carboxylesterase [Flavobacterium caeni]|uniref:Pimeloyl-ACP methyl ester carboxylesterase n=2 Tax=Flavobacterium caeni TaxID=490189 RepID=A0A1G5BIQ8_9FLAO|nr:Pimeloyl-ACP methyl ester carboxylesterase [Flavobacterium caeni]
MTMRKAFLLLLTVVILASCAVTQDSNDYVFPTRTGKLLYLRSYNNALRLWKVKYEEADVVTSYGLAHVIVSGPKNGKPVVLMHGTDASSTMWFPNVKALSQKHRVYAIDYPLETGKSLATVKDMEPKDMVAFYNQVFAHYNLKDINLVAASRGGWIATLLTLEPENRVAKLALLSPAQTFGGVDKLGKAFTAVKLKMFPSPKRLNKFFEQFSKHPEKIDRKYKEQFYLANKFGRSKPDLIKMYRFPKEQLQTLAIPVMVLVGDHDVINDRDILQRAAETIPHVDTLLVKDAGHFISIDQAAIVNQSVIEFIDKK